MLPGPLTCLLPAIPVSLLVMACASPAPPPSARTAVASPAVRTPPDPIATSPHVALGVPRDLDPSDDYLADRGVFVMSYSDRRRVPNWVAWRLVSSDLGDEDRADNFRADPDLPASFLRVGARDYERSGYDRGHMCPSAHRTATRAANSLTFLMTNMQPQVHALNAGPWKSLETYEREQAAAGKAVLVVAGGVFSASPKTIGPSIAVPGSSFRITVVLDPGEGPDDMTAATPVIATVMPNDTSARGHRWSEFRVSVDEVERATGYDFLARVRDDLETLVEARVE